MEEEQTHSGDKVWVDEAVGEQQTQADALKEMARDPKAFAALMKMLGTKRQKRGITKPLFNRVKARAKGKAARKARKANTGSRGKGSCASYTNRAGAPRG